MKKLIAWLREPETLTMPRWQRYVIGYVIVSVNVFAVFSLIYSLAGLVLS